MLTPIERIMQVSVLAVACTIVVGLATTRCDPDRPIDVGVEPARCPDASTTPPAQPLQYDIPPPYLAPLPYASTPSELEVLRLIDQYHPDKMSISARDAWWRRYRVLFAQAYRERQDLVRDK